MLLGSVVLNTDQQVMGDSGFASFLNAFGYYGIILAIFLVPIGIVVGVIGTSRKNDKLVYAGYGTAAAAFLLAILALIAGLIT